MNKVMESLMLIRSQIDELSSADKTSREVYYQCVKDFILHSIQLFPAYVQLSGK